MGSKLCRKWHLQLGDVIHHAITGLTAGTTYYAVAKVTNSFNASAYGSVVSFKASDRAFTKNSIPGSFFGSMPMISMEMETQIPSRRKLNFCLDRQINQGSHC